MKKILTIIILLFSAFLLMSQKQKEEIFKGIASFYHSKYNGKTTSNGEKYNSKKYTAASNTLKLGTYAKVTNPENGKSVYVKINDRLSKYNKRLIDLSKISATQLGYTKKGITDVIVEVVPEDEGKEQIAQQYLSKKETKSKHHKNTGI